MDLNCSSENGPVCFPSLARKNCMVVMGERLLNKVNKGGFVDIVPDF
jgi:hypothetical protein